MRVAVGVFAWPSEEQLTFIEQLGVTDVILWAGSFKPQAGNSLSPLPYKELIAIRRQIEDHGMRLFAVESPPIRLYDKIIFGDPGRDQQADAYCQSIVNVGRAGISTLGYNWIPAGVWRTELTKRIRGSAITTGFDLNDVRNAPLIRDRRYPSSEILDNYAWFLDRVLPVAEAEGVTLALHPNDPPVAELGGVASLAYDLPTARRALELRPSDNHAFAFCLGNWAIMGCDVIDVIKEFAPLGKIPYLHFQSVNGSAERYHENFIEQGKLCPSTIIRVLMEVGFTGVMIPGHVPLMINDTLWKAEDGDVTPYSKVMGGYLGRSYTVGYLKGVIDTIYSEGDLAAV